MFAGGIPDPVKHRVPVPGPSAAPEIEGKLSFLGKLPCVCSSPTEAVASQSESSWLLVGALLPQPLARLCGFTAAVGAGGNDNGT